MTAIIPAATITMTALLFRTPYTSTPIIDPAASDQSSFASVARPNLNAPLPARISAVAIHAYQVITQFPVRAVLGCSSVALLLPLYGSVSISRESRDRQGVPAFVAPACRGIQPCRVIDSSEAALFGA